MMLNCRQVTANASAWLERDLPWRQRMTHRLHLLICRHCRRYLAQLRQVVGLLDAFGNLRDDPAATAPPAIVDLYRRR